MGMLMLSNFRELLVAGTKKGLGDSTLDSFINMAYIDVMTQVEHEALRTCATLETVEGQQGYPIPEGLLGIDSVVDYTNKRILIRTDISNIKQYDTENNGYPRVWARSGGGVILSPTPAGVYTVQATFWKEGVALSAADDVTALPATWDTAIYLLAVHYVKATIDGLDEEAEKWFFRADRYIKSRLTDVDWSAGALSMPITVAKSFDDLGAFRQGI